MTDLTPNDLSHLSDAEFQSLCPQGEHAPGPEPLSPTAQAVLDAFLNGYICGPSHGDAFQMDRNGIAAAFRTAADQLIDVKWSVEMWELHQEFHAIAIELETK